MSLSALGVSVWIRGALRALQEYDLCLALGEDPTRNEFKVAHKTGWTLPAARAATVNFCWNRKEAELRAAGRITAEGFVRVVPGYVRPEWTIAAIRKLWPGLTWEESVAILIKCNGVLEEKDMDAREMVVEVVREVVKQEMTQMFGTLLAGLRAGTQAIEEKADGRPAVAVAVKVGRACGVCREPGHRRESCPTKAKAWAAEAVAA